MEQGFLRRQDIELPISWSEGTVNYPAAHDLNFQWLRKAFDQFEHSKHGARQSDLEAFACAQSFWLGDFTLFTAIGAKRAPRTGPDGRRSCGRASQAR